MRLIPIKITCIVFLSLLLSCKNNKSPFYDEILKTEKGQLRGGTIGTTIEDIKSLENEAFLREGMADYLYYDYELSMGNSYTITYDFSSDKELYEIELAVFLDVIEDAGVLFNNFSDHFNRAHGIGKKEEDGYITWETSSRISSNRVAISMIDDSESYGFITILVSDLEY